MLGHCQHCPLAGDNSQDLHFHDSQLDLSCGSAVPVGLGCHSSAHIIPTREGPSAEAEGLGHSNFLPEQQALCCSPDPLPANFLCLGSFQLGPAPAQHRDAAATPSLSGMDAVLAQLSHPILQGTFSFPCMSQGAGGLLCLSCRVSVFLKVLEMFCSG